MKFAIRTDSSTKIGSGHLMRCLTLAEELREKNQQVVFVCRELEGNLIHLIKQKGFEVFSLPFPSGDFEADPSVPHSKWLETSWQNDLEQTKEALKIFGEFDWLVVDHYALDCKWEAEIRDLTRKIMVIDDLADRKHDCDLLLDQNLYENMEVRYQGLVPDKCKLLLGPQYVLLRKEFKEARKNLRKRDGSIKRILIFFGGVDPTNETEKALKAIDELNKPEIVIDVVVGASNPNKQQIEKLCSERPNTNFYCQVQNMAELMNEADLAIGAGGTTTWERCYLGLPSIVVPIADNQVAIVEYAFKKGILKYSQSNNSKKTLQYLREIISNQEKYLDLTNCCHNMFKADIALMDCFEEFFCVSN